MSIFSKLVSQTAIYGLSSIVGRFLNYLLVPVYTYYFAPAEYGVISEFYAYAGFFSVLLVLGFETGYFRFRGNGESKRDSAYATALWFIVLLNLAFVSSAIVNQQALATLIHYAEHPEYIVYFTAILSLDAVSAIPFARLRAENKALRFATIKLTEIIITIGLSLFFIVYCPKLHSETPDSPLLFLYQPQIGVAYVFIANLIASAGKFLLLTPELLGLRWGIKRQLFIKMLVYSTPMAIVGFAGIINEMLDRALLKYLLPHDVVTNMKMLGIYSACYKLSILMSLFIQAFRYAAEPFFFSYSRQQDAKLIYAKVLNYFVIFCVFIFLLVTLFIDFFQYFVGEAYRSGLTIVPILLIANLCLGIHVNLSIWYKLTDRTGLGAWLSIAGALLTVTLNYYWIPLYGYTGAAWATLICYGAMAMVSYLLGQLYYPVAYDIKRLIGYIVLGISLFKAKEFAIIYSSLNAWLVSGLLLTVYLLFVVLFEKPAKRAPVSC